MLLTLGLLYKLQRIHDSNPNSWYNHPDIFVQNDQEEQKLLHTFGFYWHYCMKVAEALRLDKNNEYIKAYYNWINFRSIDNKGTGNNIGEDGELIENEVMN